MEYDDDQSILYIDTSPDSRIEQFDDVSYNPFVRRHPDGNNNDSFYLKTDELSQPTEIDDDTTIEISPVGSSNQVTEFSQVEGENWNTSFSDDEDLEPSTYEKRSRSWWCNRFEILAAGNDNLDEVAEDVYLERKAICSEEKKGFFYRRQIARELVGLMTDVQIPLLWRTSFLQLCENLCTLSPDNVHEKNSSSVEESDADQLEEMEVPD